MVELLKDLIVQIHLISIYDDHKGHVMEVTVEMMMTMMKKLKLERMIPMMNLLLTVVVVVLRIAIQQVLTRSDMISKNKKDVCVSVACGTSF